MGISFKGLVCKECRADAKQCLVEGADYLANLVGENKVARAMFKGAIGYPFMTALVGVTHVAQSDRCDHDQSKEADEYPHDEMRQLEIDNAGM